MLCLLAAVTLPFTGNAQNPVIQTIYTADPAPLVYNDTVWLYTGHDEDSSTWFTMKDWRLFSSTDMVNWTAHGAPLSVKTFGWASKDAWAGQCIFRNGKFYWYVPMNQANGKGMAIGVAVADNPRGPFTDPLEKPLVHSGGGDIDPSVFIDDNGKAYLYWGNPYLKYVKLNEDMISYSGEVITVPLTKEGFNVRYKDADKRPSAYEEGPWLYKRNNLYYLFYAAGGVPEHLAYSTGTGPEGPWMYRDTIMGIIKNGGAFTNHPGVIDYKGKTYLFYHNGALPGGGGFTRSVCVDELRFNTDGTVSRITPTAVGVAPVADLNPYHWIAAATIAWEKGVETSLDPTAGICVTDIDNGDYIKVRNVDFGKGPSSFLADVTALSGGTIEIRIDSLTGTLMGTCDIKKSSEQQNLSQQQCKVKRTQGVHDVYFVFKGGAGDLFHFNRWKFVR